MGRLIRAVFIQFCEIAIPAPSSSTRKKKRVQQAEIRLPSPIQSGAQHWLRDTPRCSFRDNLKSKIGQCVIVTPPGRVTEDGGWLDC